MGTRRNYTPEFKREAVDLASQPGQTLSRVARDLGIRANLLGRWKRELSEQGSSCIAPSDAALNHSVLLTIITVRASWTLFFYLPQSLCFRG
jgi:transposase-like protein